MITGTIAVVIGIAMIACAGNGEWGAFAVGAVIVVLLLALGSASREQDRAYLNWEHYWATGEAPGRKANKPKHRKTIDEIQTERGLTKAGDEWTAGKVGKEETTYPCPGCGEMMNEDHRVEYSSGTVYVTYKCKRCGKDLPVKVK